MGAPRYPSTPRAAVAPPPRVILMVLGIRVRGLGFGTAWVQGLGFGV